MKKNYFKILLILITVTVFNSCKGGQKQDNAKTKQEQVIDQITENMVLVEGGKFIMGCKIDDVHGVIGDGNQDHEVALPSYYICKYEVTQEEWETILGNNPSPEKGNNLPVSNVSWSDCILFLNELNALSNKQFRLPTEAEWEYAALGGRKSNFFMFSGSNNLNKVAWHGGNTSTFMEVGTKEPNELGLYDMSGNVREWCHDYFSVEYYGEDFVYNPQGPTEEDSYKTGNGGKHVVRGDSVWRGWYEVKARDASFDRNIDIGLRLAISQ